MKCFIYVPHSYATKFHYIFKIKLCFRKFSIANLKCFFRINIKSASVGASRTLVYEPGCRKRYLILDLRLVCQLNVTKSTWKMSESKTTNHVANPNETSQRSDKSTIYMMQYHDRYSRSDSPFVSAFLTISCFSNHRLIEWPAWSLLGLCP